VNTGTGEFYFELPLFNLKGPLPLLASLYYGSSSAERILSAASDAADSAAVDSFLAPLGRGWLHNYQMRRFAFAAAWETHVVYDQGRVLPFWLRHGSWELEEPADAPYQLEADGEGGFYLLDPEKDAVYGFGADRRLTRVEDRNGNGLTLTYDGDGRLVQVADGLGRALQYTYDGDRLTAIGDQSGRAYAFAYTDGLLTSVTDPLGERTVFAYDSDGRITAVTYPSGHTPYTQTYSEGRVVRQQDAYGNVTTLSAGTGDSAQVAYPDGSRWQHRHEERVDRSVLAGFTDPAGEAVGIAPVAGGGLELTDRHGDHTRVDRDAISGDVSQVTDALGQTTRYSYATTEQSIAGIGFLFRDRTAVTYPDGAREEYVYDGPGNVVERRDRVGQVWRQTYNERG